MYAATSGYRNDNDAGLSLVGARYYDSQLGRFITRDSYISQKHYLYCGHDPINHLDSSGHWVIQLIIAIAAVIIPSLIDDANENPEPGWGASVIGDGVIDTIGEAADMGGLDRAGGAAGTIGAGLGAAADGIGIVVKYRKRIKDFSDPDGEWAG